MNESSQHTAADRLIVQQVLKGNRFAFSRILEDTGNLVAQIIYRMGIPIAERDDLAQDIYLRVYNKLDTFRFQSRLSTWIAQIAYNACADYLAIKKIELLPLDEFAEGSNEDQSADQPLLQKQQAESFTRAMKSLPPLYSTLISLYHQEELNYEEIAGVTGLPLGTVKNYLFRARKLLKDKL